MSNTTNKIYVLLLGASVGKAWDIVQLPERVSCHTYLFEYAGAYQFDKSRALQELLSRTCNKPDAIFIKECAAYFPSDITFDDAKRLVIIWVDECRKNGVIPIPTTVCPITRTRDDRYKTKNPLKRFIKTVRGISMQTCMDRIREYNDWIKDCALKNNLAVLDLEEPLRICENERYLRDDLTLGDGLHLNSAAYHLLDRIVIPTLERVNWK